MTGLTWGLMSARRIRIAVFAALLCACTVYAGGQEMMRFMTYNVENFFDTEDDALTDDDDFLPEAIRHWTVKRYRAKVANVSRVIAAAGGWNPPAVVGLCEVENDYVMRSLTLYGPLRQLGYEALHYDSPDGRGIDVALLYRPEIFTPVVSRPLRVETGEGEFSRDILYVMGTLPDGTQLHLFHVHFPSRREGQKESEPKRVKAAAVLRGAVDSVFAADSGAAVVIMGDFNDTPADRPVADVLKAMPLPPDGAYVRGALYNLTYAHSERGEGSYCYKGVWQMLDQVIVSGSMLDGSAPLQASPESVDVMHEQWMMERSGEWLDSLPKRTYKGMRYNGGYSDHLPVCFDLKLSGGQ